MGETHPPGSASIVIGNVARNSADIQTCDRRLASRFPSSSDTASCMQERRRSFAKHGVEAWNPVPVLVSVVFAIPCNGERIPAAECINPGLVTNFARQCVRVRSVAAIFWIVSPLLRPLSYGPRTSQDSTRPRLSAPIRLLPERRVGYRNVLLQTSPLTNGQH